MKILFDENVPLPLRQFFVTQEVTTVQKEGWAGTENGQIIELADRKFDVLLLADKNLRYQQNLTGRNLALVELPTNRLPLLLQIIDKIVKTVEQAKPGTYSIIEL